MRRFTPIKAPYNPSAPTDVWQQVAGIIHIPKDTFLPDGSFPIILDFHGVGEAGNGIQNTGELEKLVGQGLCNVVDNYDSPIGIDPSTGKPVKFGVLAMQNTYYSPEPTWFRAILPWLFKNYNVSKRHIFVSGLSAGGHKSLEMVTHPDLAPYLAASVHMSVVAYPKAVQAISDNEIKTVFMTGDNDPQATTQTREAYQIVNGVYETKELEWKGGHGPWIDKWYKDGSWDGSLNFNIPNFFLANPKGGIPIPAPTPVPAPTVKTLIDMTINNSRYIIKDNKTWSDK